MQGRRQIQTRMEHISTKESKGEERKARGDVKGVRRTGLGRNEVGAVRGADLWQASLSYTEERTENHAQGSNSSRV